MKKYYRKYHYIKYLRSFKYDLSYTIVVPSAYRIGLWYAYNNMKLVRRKWWHINKQLEVTYSPKIFYFNL